MHLIHLDGAAKVGKGCVGEAMQQALTKDGLHVEMGVAGDFFRRLTVAAMHRSGRFGLDPEALMDDRDRLEELVDGIIAEGVAYDDFYRWGDLQDPLVTDKVGNVGRLSIAQTAGDQWYDRRADLAQRASADVLILDGRNPHLRLAEWQQNTDTPSSINLFLVCEVAEAARRTLWRELGREPTSPELEAKTQSLAARRADDADPKRKNAFVEPRLWVPFVPGQDRPVDALDQSYAPIAHDEELPMAIMLDNTSIPKHLLCSQTAALARVAIGCLVQ